jgi:hypothetical protein
MMPEARVAWARSALRRAGMGKPLAQDSKTGTDRLGYQLAPWQQAVGQSVLGLAPGRPLPDILGPWRMECCSPA